MRTRVLLAGFALGALAGVTACGSSEDGGSTTDSTPTGGSTSTSEYCARLKADKGAFGTFSTDDMAGIDQAFTKLIALGRDAPDEVADDWKVVAGGAAEVQKAFRDAGVGEEDYAALEAGKFPAGVDVQKYQEAGRKFRALSDTRFTEAAGAIAAHAKKACKVDLS